MKSKVCPKCGFKDESGFEICPSCGVVIAKVSKMSQGSVNNSNEPHSLFSVLKRFERKTIGINYDDHTKAKKAYLVKCGDDCFTVVNEEKIIFHFPYDQILSIIESRDDKVSTGVFHGEFPLIVKVFHLVIYKGAIGIGAMIPLDN